MSESTNGNNDRDDEVTQAKKGLASLVNAKRNTNHYQPLTRAFQDANVPIRTLRRFRSHPDREGIGDITKGKRPVMINLVEFYRRVQTGKVRL